MLRSVSRVRHQPDCERLNHGCPANPPLARRFVGCSAWVRILSVLLWGLGAWTSGAEAQCDEDIFQVEETAPASDARDVPLNAYIQVTYSPCYFSRTGQDPATSIEVRRAGEIVPGTAELGDDQTLFFIFDELLAPNQTYEVVARDFSGGFPFSFSTAFGLDMRPPVFGEISDVVSTRVSEGTADAPEGSYRVDVSFEPAVDDGAAGSIEYLLYLSRGPEDLEAPELVARTRNFSTNTITMAFVLDAVSAESPICVVVHAVDGVGQADSDQTPRCFEPIMGSFFEGCAAVGQPDQAAWIVLVLGWMWRRRQRV